MAALRHMEFRSTEQARELEDKLDKGEIGFHMQDAINAGLVLSNLAWIKVHFELAERLVKEYNTVSNKDQYPGCLQSEEEQRLAKKLIAFASNEDNFVTDMLLDELVDSGLLQVCDIQKVYPDLSSKQCALIHRKCVARLSKD